MTIVTFLKPHVVLPRIPPTVDSPAGADTAWERVSLSASFLTFIVEIFRHSLAALLPVDEPPPPTLASPGEKSSLACWFMDSKWCSMTCRASCSAGRSG